MVLWIVRILFAPNHFKLPLHTRLYCCIFGGYMVDQAALYDFKHNDKKQYLSEFDWYRSRCINDPYSEMLNNKVVFTQIIERYCKTPEIYCVKKDDRLAGLNGRVINDYDDLVKLLHEVGAYVVKPVRAGKGKGVYKFTMAISPLDCMGCGVCIGACPVNALSMVAQEGELPQQDVFDYCVAEVSEKKDMQDNTVKGSQFKQPMLEFSGSCAGCAETSYARLVTQLFGDHMYISNATGCSSIWGGPAATSPYCTNKEGHGPAWCNSLFEDNAEHGLGMFVGQDKIRQDLADETRQLIAVEWARPELKAAAQAWLDTMNDGTANAEPAKAYVKALEESICTVEELAAMPQLAAHAAELKAKGALLCDCAACTLAADILSKKEYLAKKSMWIFGGDGWAYDIGYGGLDHVIASKKDVNIFVFDTEVYSNTGGQASKASNIGQVAQFAAAGKEVKKKSLAEIAMQYGYVYVAQVAMGANPAQTIKAITEAEAYHGPSLIIGYSPCEMHSIKGGMMNCQKEMKKAVDCGYWNLFRYNPDGGDKKFTLDSKAPAGGYQEFLMNEARYSRLTREFPERADVLFKRNEDEAKARYEHLLKLIDMYDK